MATEQWIRRGGTEPEYQIYQALHRRGWREPRDFGFRPGGTFNISFAVASPRSSIYVGQIDQARRLEMSKYSEISPDVSVISDGAALFDSTAALSAALGGF